MAKFELKRKETGTKTIVMATANYAPCRVLYGVKCPCKVSIALLHPSQRYAWLCVLTLAHTLWCHWYLICILEETWISLGRKKISQNEKRHPSLLWKAFSISLFFNSSIFTFHRHFNACHPLKDRYTVWYASGVTCSRYYLGARLCIWGFWLVKNGF